jgi:hypothetical protein
MPDSGRNNIPEQTVSADYMPSTRDIIRLPEFVDMRSSVSEIRREHSERFVKPIRIQNPLRSRPVTSYSQKTTH